MARKKYSRRTIKASPEDIAEVASGRGSASDKREMGFVKKGGRLRPGKRTPAALKRRVARKRGRKRN